MWFSTLAAMLTAVGIVGLWISGRLRKFCHAAIARLLFKQSDNADASNGHSGKAWSNRVGSATFSSA
jgi:hypothetical protein